MLQFPWILQQNLEAAARSAEKREAARRAASGAAAAGKKRRLQRLPCEMRGQGDQVSVFSFLEERTFSAHEDLFELCCMFFF